MKILVATLLLVLACSDPLAVYYCGFSGSYCGQSTTDDTNVNSTLIVLAFANINSTGGIVLDTSNYPCALVSKWQNQGKKVFLSIGGQNAAWTSIFQTNASKQQAIDSIEYILSQTGLDGIDLDLEDYSTDPKVVAGWITALKVGIRGKFLSVAPQCVGIYQGQPVSTTTWNSWNYWVPIINQSISSIDLVMVQAYNNWYDGLQGGTISYIQDVYLNWINAKSPFCIGCSVIPNFSGVPSKKLAIGLLASIQAGNSGYYASGSVIDSFQQWLSQNTYAIAGFMIWDSHWDSANGYNISNAIITNYNSTPFTPPVPSPPALCVQ